MDGQNLAFLSEMADAHPAAAVFLYMGVTVVGSVVLALPGVAFAILAGLLFGPVAGTFYCLFAATLGAMAAFLAGRYFLRDSLKPAISKNRYIKQWLFDETGKNELVLLMITRLVPLFSYNLQNFAYGITDISFLSYSVWTFVFMLPGTAMYTFGAAGLADGENRMQYFLYAAFFAVFALGLGACLRKRFMKPGGAEEEGLDRKEEKTKGEGRIEETEKTGEAEAIWTEEAARCCIHCHLCRESCLFLKKYGLDAGDGEKLEPLAYHCFLCGTCTAVCPAGIDGRELCLSLRRKRTRENQGACGEKGYALLLAEKQNYLFRNKRHMKGKRVLFPGCNFPSFYPETTRALIRLWEEKTGMGVLYDCCGKPVAELGMEEKEKKILSGLEERLKKAGVQEVVTLCPNCYYYLRERISIPVASIYEELDGLGIRKKIEGEAPLFLPCPDRKEERWRKALGPFFSQAPRLLTQVQCCGLGGCASAKEPELAREMALQIGALAGGTVYTYCASCAGSLSRNGVQVRHCLPELLGIREEPDTAGSWKNRAMTKWR